MSECNLTGCDDNATSINGFCDKHESSFQKFAEDVKNNPNRHDTERETDE